MRLGHVFLMQISFFVLVISRHFQASGIDDANGRIVVLQVVVVQMLQIWHGFGLQKYRLRLSFDP